MQSSSALFDLFVPASFIYFYWFLKGCVISVLLKANLGFAERVVKTKEKAPAKPGPMELGKYNLSTMGQFIKGTDVYNGLYFFAKIILGKVEHINRCFTGI